MFKFKSKRRRYIESLEKKVEQQKELIEISQRIDAIQKKIIANDDIIISAYKERAKSDEEIQTIFKSMVENYKK